MKRVSIVVVAMICGFSTLFGARTATALEQWQQVPGTAVWMSVPNGWKAVGHRHKHALLLSSAGASDTILIAEQARDRKLDAFILALQDELKVSTSDEPWRATNDGGWMVAGKAGTIHVVLHAQRVKGWNVAIRSTTLADTAAAFSALHARVLSGLHIGWKRPRPTRLTVPGTSFEVRHPEGDWIIRSMDSRAIHWGNGASSGTIQVGHYPMTSGGLRAVVGHVSQGMAGTEGQWTWQDVTPWKSPIRRAKGLFLRGEAPLRRNRKDVVYRLDVFAFQDGNLAVMAVSTSYGSANKTVSAELRKFVKTFRKVR